MNDQPTLATWQQARHDRDAVVADLEAGIAVTLPAGARLHGALGRLVYQDDGTGVQCHLCAHRNLAQHICRHHQMSPADYWWG